MRFLLRAATLFMLILGALTLTGIAQTRERAAVPTLGQFKGRLGTSAWT